VKVGFIGLGRMGGGMARRLIDGGHDVIGYNRSSGPGQGLIDAGGRLGASIADACVERDVVITMLVDDAAVLQAALSAGGMRDSLPRGAVHLAMGTYGVDAVLTLTAAHEQAGQHLVAAPVLGRPDLAAKGELGIVVAGADAAVRACEPLLSLMGRRLFNAGTTPASAAAVKLANNHVLGCAIVAMAEAFSLAGKYGVTRQVLYDVMTEGLFSATAYKVYGKAMVQNTYDQAGSPVTVGLKDANLILAAAERVHVPMPALQVYKERLLAAIAHGDGARDQAVLARESG
jgi:3-hydroxyisobutyrate dehydrogenase-like beta-hydroxyacid dehydrogenase